MFLVVLLTMRVEGKNSVNITLLGKGKKTGYILFLDPHCNKIPEIVHRLLKTMNSDVYNCVCSTNNNRLGQGVKLFDT